MNPYKLQRFREDRIDMWLAAALLVVLFGGMALLPRSLLWFLLVPLAAFWVRWNYVRVRRDEASREAEAAADVERRARGDLTAEEIVFAYAAAMKEDASLEAGATAHPRLGAPRRDGGERRISLPHRGHQRLIARE